MQLKLEFYTHYIKAQVPPPHTHIHTLFYHLMRINKIELFMGFCSAKITKSFQFLWLFRLLLNLEHLRGGTYVDIFKRNTSNSCFVVASQKS